MNMYKEKYSQFSAFYLVKLFFVSSVQLSFNVVLLPILLVDTYIYNASKSHFVYDK